MCSILKSSVFFVSRTETLRFHITIYILEIRYVEGDAWHYRFFAPHAMDSLVSEYGDDVFAAALERLFVGAENGTHQARRAQTDGMVGQCGHRILPPNIGNRHYFTANTNFKSCIVTLFTACEEQCGTRRLTAICFALCY